MRIFRAALAVAAVFSLPAQNGPQVPIHPGPGDTPPRAIKHVEPEYTNAARDQFVQGTVLFQLVVDTTGMPRDIQLLSPLGFGLDENAQAAIEKWRFRPGRRNGQPVSMIVTVEVNFRFRDAWFDSKTERQRTRYNVALAALIKDDANARGDAVSSVLDLAQQQYPPAMYLAGRWKMEGQYVAADAAEGLGLVRKSADRHYGPAIYEVAMRALQGKDAPPDVQRGLKLMRDAATLGSVQAQFYLGEAYEIGNSVPKDLARARSYFRLCAARGQALCQARLAGLLFNDPRRSEDDYLESLAWYQLAADQGAAEAREIVGREIVKLSEAQAKTVKVWQNQLVHK